MDYPKINKNDKQSVDGIESLRNHPVLEPHFISMIVGKPGSGKTYLIEQLLNNEDLYFKKFDYVFIVSPSAFKTIKLAAGHSNTVYDLLWIAQKIKEVTAELSKDNNPDSRYNVLFIFDDVISSIKSSERSDFQNNLFYNRRNIIDRCTISIIITTQKFNLLPAKLRSVLTSLIIFNLSLTDFKLACNDLPFIDKQEFKGICQKTFAIPRQFVYVRLQPFRICINFEPQILQRDLTDFVAGLRKEFPYGVLPSPRIRQSDIDSITKSRGDVQRVNPSHVLVSDVQQQQPQPQRLKQTSVRPIAQQRQHQLQESRLDSAIGQQMAEEDDDGDLVNANDYDQETNSIAPTADYQQPIQRPVQSSLAQPIARQQSHQTGFSQGYANRRHALSQMLTQPRSF